MSKSRRADAMLVAAGLFESRAKAVAAIEAGLVTADGRPVLKASMPLAADARIESRPAFPWVSRGGLKLVAGLDMFGIDPGGCSCLDLGASTGGFTDVLLARGARRVTSVDVGHGQFHPRLRADPRVRLLEGRDARSLDAETLGQPYDLMVCDVSFIPLRLVLPGALALSARDARAIVLIKPQFEAGRDRVKKGLVRDAAVHEDVCRDVAAMIEAQGWALLGIVPSPIAGRDGNAEFLLGTRRDHA